MRGGAALVVMVYHVSLVYRPHLSENTWAWLTQSPLKLLFVGTEAVMVFFVLSGLVVALPALKSAFEWRTYYPQRVLRLYLPVAASLVAAAILILVLPRDPSAVPDGSWMRDAQATRVTPESFFSEASLLRVTYDINNVLWSLRWELFFSLLLPLFVLVAKAARAWAWPLAVLCACLSIAGRMTSIDWLTYFPVFMLGTIIAVRLEDIVAWGRQQRSAAVWAGISASAALCLGASWFGRPLFPSGSVENRILWGLAAVGAALVIVLAIAWPRLRGALETGAVQWLGRVSFSLYLVHAPILGSLGFLFGDTYWWAVGPVGIPLSLAASALFFRYVEVPTQQFSRKAGRSIAAAVGVPVAPPSR